MPLIQYLSRISFDFGAVSGLGEEIERLRLKRPLLVTDPGVAGAGILERALHAAPQSDIVVYDRTTENPTEQSLLIGTRARLYVCQPLPRPFPEESLPSCPVPLG